MFLCNNTVVAHDEADGRCYERYVLASLRPDSVTFGTSAERRKHCLQNQRRKRICECGLLYAIFTGEGMLSTCLMERVNSVRQKFDTA
jgi:hypothetical protein